MRLILSDEVLSEVILAIRGAGVLDPIHTCTMADKVTIHIRRVGAAGGGGAPVDESAERVESAKAAAVGGGAGLAAALPLALTQPVRSAERA